MLCCGTLELQANALLHLKIPISRPCVTKFGRLYPTSANCCLLVPAQRLDTTHHTELSVVGTVQQTVIESYKDLPTSLRCITKATQLMRITTHIFPTCDMFAFCFVFFSFNFVFQGRASLCNSGCP